MKSSGALQVLEFACGQRRCLRLYISIAGSGELALFPLMISAVSKTSPKRFREQHIKPLHSRSSRLVVAFYLRRLPLFLKLYIKFEMAFLYPDDKRTLLKRPSDGDIGGDLRNREKYLERSDEMHMLRDRYPDYDPTTAQKLKETQSAIDEWLVTSEKLRQTANIWEAKDIVDKLLKSINNLGYVISKVLKERKEFDMHKRINRTVDSSQSQSNTVKPDPLFDFGVLLKKLEQLRKVVEEAGIQSFRKGHCDVEDIMKELNEVMSVIPNVAPSQGILTCLDSSAMDVPAHKHDRTSPDDELEKHPSRPDAINSKPKRGKAEVDKLECAAISLLTMPATEEPENEHAVTTWECAAMSLLTMQPPELILDDVTKSNIWKLAARYMLEIQPSHESEGTLPGIGFITIQIEQRGLNGIKVVPLQQMERLLSGIPDAQTVAVFILTHLPDEHHALLSCTTIFAVENTPIWRGHVLFEEWSEEENVAFACEFSRLVHEPSATTFVLQKWHGLLEVLNPIMISISSLCFAQT
ncbi:hypothetical protein VC83_07576 [Pseudogymnoascus destructans]|uniref:Uncharacterized protein n=1 Tax=Pseudogymnoascus destructans TaxID=655981 RepID=A0A177A035_9PEZI|nr:uncharacterized protein VC83_07576 [Pseudogymnoascus destructans]OAF55508.1 hypothetical protein VC83_07576 [Pseudogymnoascus destructans]